MHTIITILSIVNLYCIINYKFANYDVNRSRGRLSLQNKLSTFGSALWALHQATPPVFGRRNQAHVICRRRNQAHVICRAMITSPNICTPRLVYSFKCNIYRKCTCRLIILIYHLLYILLWLQSYTKIRGFWSLVKWWKGNFLVFFKKQNFLQLT